MRESLGLFQSLLRLDIFHRVEIYILLNKVDVFRRMISRVPVSEYFPDYAGGTDCFNACKFFADSFMSISNSRKATTHIFPMSAVDSISVRDVALCVRDLLESDSFEKCLLGRGSSHRNPSRRHPPEPSWRPYNRITAWSWAAMDPDISRGRETYMMTASQSGARSQKPRPTETNGTSESGGWVSDRWMDRVESLTVFPSDTLENED